MLYKIQFIKAIRGKEDVKWPFPPEQLSACRFSILILSFLILTILILCQVGGLGGAVRLGAS